MSRPRISPKISVPVWTAFRRHCHKFLAIGYEQAILRIQNGPDEETDITGYLCEAIDEWFRAHSADSFCFFIQDDPPIGGTERTGKRRLRTDIIIGYAAGDRPEFYFEAKRLHRTKAGASRCSGLEGMGCFISGRYAKRYCEVAMIGYVQSDTPEHWHAALQSKIKKDQYQLKVDNIEKSVCFLDSFPLEWASTHQRDGLTPVKVFHILLDCRQTAK